MNTISILKPQILRPRFEFPAWVRKIAAPLRMLAPLGGVLTPLANPGPFNTTFTVTLQPTPGQDNRIASNNANTNFSTDTTIQIGDSSSVTMATRMLLAFDIMSVVPPTLTVTGVTIQLFETAAGDTAGIGSWAVNFRRALRAWITAQSTWNSWKTSSAWTTAGAGSDGNDRAAAVSATLTLDGVAAAAFVSFAGATLLDDVQKIINGTYNNYGWEIEAPAAENSVVAGQNSFNSFVAGDNATAANRPKITITGTWTPTTGVAGPLTKNASNPLFGTLSNTWDKDKNKVSVVKISSTYYMWYCGVDSTGHLSVCYATSSDGISWTKPNLGLVTYGGNTNNNITLDNVFMGEVNYYSGASASLKYILLVEDILTASDPGIYIYNSSDGNNWSLLKTVAKTSTRGTYLEGKSLHQMQNGQWLAFYTQGHTSQRRAVGAYQSATSDLTSAWADLGLLITTSDQDTQKYSLQVVDSGGTLHASVGLYNKTTELMRQELYQSNDDGLTWSLAVANWLPLGFQVGSAWDGAMSNGTSRIVTVGAAQWIYYPGFVENHAHALPRNAQIGAAALA